MISRLLLALAGAGLLAFAAGLALAGSAFPLLGEVGAAREPVVLFVIAILAVTLLYTGACVACHRSPPRLLYIILVAGAARLILLFGAPAPILEGDPQRLRFDGRMVNQGLNPYEFLPRQLIDGDAAEQQLNGPRLERLLLARAAMSSSTDSPRPEELRRPDLRSSSTPLQIWTGALADRFKPQNTRGYAFLVLLGDALAMFLLILALRRLGLPPGWLLVYAWCPILLKEAYVSLAVDPLLLPALAGLIYGIACGKRLLLAVPIALAGALRWPLLLLSLVHGRRIGLLGILLVCVLVTLPFVPLLSFMPATQSAQSYAEGPLHLWRHFEYNSLTENLLRGMFRHLPTKAENSLSLGGVTMVAPDERLDVLLAKVIAALLLLGVITYLVIRVPSHLGGEDSGRRDGFTDLFVAIAALLLLSPVLTPAHALWLLPVLVVRPSGVAWLMFPALVSTCYLTHLVGPDAADLTLFGGKLSFRLFEYGVFGLLLLFDLLWKDTLFPMPEPVALAEQNSPVEEEFALDLVEADRLEAEAALPF